MSSDKAFCGPSHSSQEHQHRRRPRQSQKFVAPRCIDINIRAVFIDHLHGLGSRIRHDCRHDDQNQHCRPSQRDVCQRTDPAMREDACSGRQQCEPNEYYADTIQNERRVEGGPQVVYSVLDSLWPVQRRQIDVQAARV